MSVEQRRSTPTDAVLLTALYALEASVLLAAIGLHGHGLGSRLFVGASIGAVLASGLLAWRARRHFPGHARAFWMTVAMNLVTLAFAGVAAEIVLRATVTRKPQGEFVGGRLLPPRRWADVAAWNRQLLDRNPSNISYFIADDLLGWTIGPTRVSKDGVCASSVEGIRSADPSVVYLSTRPRHRIALVGDSFTFGLEVPFADSWGHVLETRLGSEAQVLNFGVDGYGFDQAYLRFQRDVRPVAPDVVVFGFIYHDLDRTMAVYNFIDFPEWGFPFSKPRLVLEKDETLKVVNAPLIRPEDLFSTTSIDELPFLELDARYRSDDWRPTRYDWSYVLRLLFSSRPTRAVDPRNSEEAMLALNEGIVTAFARTAHADGAIPLVVYFPSRSDFGVRPDRLREKVFARFRAKGVAVIDTTSCLSKLGVETLFLPDRPHYSPAGNEAVANCLLPMVREALDQSPRSSASK